MTNSANAPEIADELSMLTGFLDHYRAVLIAKTTNLTDEQSRFRAVEPSNLSLLGLVRHMAEVERHWFRRILLNEVNIPDFYAADGKSIGTADGDFEFAENASLGDGIEVLKRAIAESNSATAGKTPTYMSLATRPKTGNQVSLRWIMIHMIEEYARHCGHADFLRERIDGRKGDN